ncbi:MAG: N-formylglutamate amidohydrolase [Candidatus Gracilibacteria bacterium]|nr:N-formylglutamate amidohydrolase [Candidatus Gracilibacteria bacterium]
MLTFPKNVLVLLSHASYFVPDEFRDNLEDYMKANNDRVLKNFSDFGTKFLISDEISKDQIIEVGFSRAIGDPNRARNAFDIFRETDFGGLKLWKKPLTEDQKEYLLKNYYDNHHSLIKEKIKELKKEHKNIFVIDIHDTGNLLMGEDYSKDKLKEVLFPELALCDSEGFTLNDEIRKVVDKSFRKNLKLETVWNGPYKYSFTSSNYADKQNGVYTLQAEFGRYLLIDEISQTYNPNVEKLKNPLCKTLTEIGEYLERL